MTRCHALLARPMVHDTPWSPSPLERMRTAPVRWRRKSGQYSDSVCKATWRRTNTGQGHVGGSMFHVQCSVFSVQGQGFWGFRVTVRA